MILIKNATIVNEDREFTGYVVIDGERIRLVGEGDFCEVNSFADGKIKTVIDADGKLLMPGVIDDQVHFRQPGLTYKGDIHSESIAAVAGGITSYMEMPNTKPPTVTHDLLQEKFDIAAQNSVSNYTFYFGATNDNIAEIRRIDPLEVCGVKLFMGSSTGNMLVDNIESLAAIFAESPVLIATHCEEESVIRRNMEYYKNLYGDNIEPEIHPLIRSAEACYASSAKAVELATKYGANLHILHLSTENELSLFEKKPLEQKKITNEVCVHHLWFSDNDYRRKGNMIKWNPAIKSETDRTALLRGIENGLVDMIATDHAPHTLEEKHNPYMTCPSGGPLVQHSLTAMLELFKKGEITLLNVVKKMCHAPAIRFAVKDRGFIREGYYADLVLVDLFSGWEVNSDNILYKCGWSPFEGDRFSNKVTHTIINGSIVYQNGVVDTEFRGKKLEFLR